MEIRQYHIHNQVHSAANISHAQIFNVDFPVLVRVRIVAFEHASHCVLTKMAAASGGYNKSHMQVLLHQVVFCSSALHRS
jgi:hypothetical protein